MSSGNASSGIPAESNLSFGSHMLPAVKAPVTESAPGGHAMAEGVMTLDSQNGNWNYTPSTSEQNLANQLNQSFTVCCFWALNSTERDNCGCPPETFWICATVSPVTNPCNYPNPPRSFNKTCPWVPITVGQITQGAGGDWSSGATIQSAIACGVNPAQGQLTVLPDNSIDYVPAEGESGSTIEFCVTIAPAGRPDCATTFVITVTFVDFCDQANFVINDVGV